MDELVEKELALYVENSTEYIKAVFAAQPYIMADDEAGYEEMLSQTKNTKTKRNVEKCQHCGSLNLVYINSEAAIICTMCSTDQTYGGNSSSYLKEQARFSTTNRVDSPHFYERKSHFLHIIREIVGICKTRIPLRVYDVVKAGELTVAGARHSLRKAKLSAHICSVPRILEQLGRYTCVTLSNSNIHTLVREFEQVSRVWDLIKPRCAPKRKGFIAYPFVLKKLCERQKLGYVCRDIKEVKSIKGCVALEKYWKLIMKKLDWD